MAELESENVEVVEAVEEVVVVKAPDLDPINHHNRPRKVAAGIWGPVEIGVVTAGVLTLLMVSVAYFFWVVPSGRELAQNRAEADRLEAELVSARSKYGDITNTETQVAKLVSSVDDFEAAYLPAASSGQSALYQRINGLISAYGLVNTTGPDFAPLEAAENKPGQDQQQEEKGRAKFRSIYPGVYVSTTLEGSYQNLRRFIREIETGREFIVVSAVELAPSESDRQSESPDRPAAPAVVPTPSKSDPNVRTMNGGSTSTSALPSGKPRPKGKMHGETVSLHIEMAAYFRRPNASPAVQ